MERLGKTFLLVIEPLDFSMKENSFNCKEFGFIVGTESSWYLNNYLGSAEIITKPEVII